MTIYDDATALQDDIASLRRSLHAEPEVGLSLPRTQEKVLSALDGLPLEISVGAGLSSVTGVLRGGRPGPVVLLRGDMDALPVAERTGLEFTSRSEAAMHACGHDLHTSMLVGAARLIAVLPLCGALSDRIGRRPNLLVFGLGMAVLSYPLARLARSGGVWQLGLAMTIALVFIALIASIAPAVFAELFPTHVRATGTAVPYAIAVALCGGTAPYLLTWLSSHHAEGWFTGYSIALLLIGVLVVLVTPETRGKTLE
ncbi:M20/M25/M40 family metallo-hydrolase [Streptomyces sp. NPDC006332]|uniref:M20/M25/M40 family metallo-hydrolase n=1 Tax=Streptomyces sp. NPDC006332 TaxID=3155456 RepID=UPI0033A3DC0F